MAKLWLIDCFFCVFYAQGIKNKQFSRGPVRWFCKTFVLLCFYVHLSLKKTDRKWKGRWDGGRSSWGRLLLLRHIYEWRARLLVLVFHSAHVLDNSALFSNNVITCMPPRPPLKQTDITFTVTSGQLCLPRPHVNSSHFLHTSQHLARRTLKLLRSLW